MQYYNIALNKHRRDKQGPTETNRDDYKEKPRKARAFQGFKWLREFDLNKRPSGYEPDELPDCSIPHLKRNGVPGRI